MSRRSHVNVAFKAAAEALCCNALRMILPAMRPSKSSSSDNSSQIVKQCASDRVAA